MHQSVQDKILVHKTKQLSTIQNQATLYVKYLNLIHLFERTPLLQKQPLPSNLVKTVNCIMSWLILFIYHSYLQL